MFDVDSNGSVLSHNIEEFLGFVVNLHRFCREIDREEFKKVMTLMRSYNRQGVSHNGGLRSGLKYSRPVEDGGLVEYFFGKDGDERLHHDKFVQFLRELQDEV